jgi:SAM-dependent methyltransferase
MPLRYNLGCGRKYLDGYVNCDVLPHVKADRRFDLNGFPYPIEAGSADEILMDNVLEHLDDVVGVMEECHRLLRPGGRLRILVPYGKTDWALQDPTHKHYFTERSMNYFTGDGAYNYYTTARFNLVEARLFCDSTNWMHKVRNLIPGKGVLRYFLWNIYDGIYFELEKLPVTAEGAESSSGT